MELSLDKNTIRTQRSELMRDYKTKKENITRHEMSVSKEITRLMQIEKFREEAFSSSLVVLKSLENKPDEIIQNMDIVLKAHKATMDKLEADIELIEKEKQSVLDGMHQYIYLVHEHMGRIDKNSTVKIRDKPIKMLKIEEPKWEDNESMYEARMRDFLEKVTNAGLEKLDNNEPIEELVSKWITTKNMYNEVVGIRSIEVKLYKIEADKEYIIRWDDVAKNSGGEGFLSAFVVLSSLLSYMRKDDTDIFGTDRESGKVLIMDNPFAQTNASHLLKPLMDMANKRNTQLICLSGLGGDSIYNCFDNIYVLNLMSSRLREGLNYMKTDHIKGTEELHKLVGVQIETKEVEQIELF